MQIYIIVKFSGLWEISTNSLILKTVLIVIILAIKYGEGMNGFRCFY